MYQYIKIFVVRLSVRNGNGRGFSLKQFILGLQRAARYMRHATVGACHCTSNRHEHKIIQRAGPEQDTIFHLQVTACRGRGSHGHDERFAWVASRGQRTSCSSSFVSKVLGANYNCQCACACELASYHDRRKSWERILMLESDWTR